MNRQWAAYIVSFLAFLAFEIIFTLAILSWAKP